MNCFILDTDHFTLNQRGDASVVARTRAVKPDQLAVTLITAEEQLSGWYTSVRKAKEADQLARAYRGLYEIIGALKKINVLPFPLTAVERWMELRKNLRRLGPMDLAIAAIVLEVGGVLVTRNRKDFEQVPGLAIEDWSKPGNATEIGPKP